MNGQLRIPSRHAYAVIRSSAPGGVIKFLISTTATKTPPASPPTSPTPHQHYHDHHYHHDHNHHHRNHHRCHHHQRLNHHHRSTTSIIIAITTTISITTTIISTASTSTVTATITTLSESFYAGLVLEPLTRRFPCLIPLLSCQSDTCLPNMLLGSCSRPGGHGAHAPTRVAMAAKSAGARVSINRDCRHVLGKVPRPQSATTGLVPVRTDFTLCYCTCRILTRDANTGA